MKKILIALLALSTCIGSFAQLKVESTGKVVVGTKLMNYGNWSAGFQSGLTSSSELNSVAIYGKSSNNSGSVSYGVFGVAESSSGIGNFGVVGCMGNSSLPGAGVLGATYHITNRDLLALLLVISWEMQK